MTRLIAAECKKQMRHEKQKLLDLFFGWISRYLIAAPKISNGKEHKKNNDL
jgi:hypothetical protein